MIVAIHAWLKPVILLRFFWRELKLIGVRVYGGVDLEKTIALAT
ncbi:hypothetical protein [Dyadobacter diqingensis]|nr:hypothetical protein [Dyadobacter diqingensis]